MNGLPKSWRHLLAATLLLASTSAAHAEDISTATDLDTGMIPAPLILLPDDELKSIVFLLSDADGWSDADRKQAETLEQQGTAVVGIDTPRYLASLARDDGDCIYTVSDIERLSQQLQRKAGNESLLRPVVAGHGAGGALALAILAQTPKATIGETLAVDPEAGIALTKQLCTPAQKTVSGDRMLYGLTDGDLPDPLTVVFTPAASAEGKSHVETLSQTHADIDVSDTDQDARTALASTLGDMLQAESDGASPLGLPLTVLEATPTQDTMAVVLSGDGGWRDIDSQVGAALQRGGIPVVGLDSLRYFWSERTPEQTADDLARILHHYLKRWKVKNVLLVGYSFGADVLPRSYGLLPEDLRQRVRQVSLLALSHQVDYEVSVSGWLGVGGAGAGDPLDDIARMDPAILQCIYGKDDDEDACSALAGSKIETVALEGGHHFDGNYAELAKRIVDGLVRRLKG